MKLSGFICVVVVLCWMAEGLVREYINAQCSLNWFNAQKFCANVYHGLAIVTNEDEYRRVREVAGKSGIGWIGMYRSEENPNVWLWSDGNKYSYFLWESGQPNNINSLQNCVLSQPGGWGDYYCQSTESVYCYRFIILVEEKKTWEQAHDYCRTHYKDLVYPTSESQLQLAEREAIQKQTNLVWTGMRFLNGNWYWVNGKQLESSISMPSCPELPYRCGARNIQKHTWENRQCSEKLPFLCYW